MGEEWVISNRFTEGSSPENRPFMAGGENWVSHCLRRERVCVVESWMAVLTLFEGSCLCREELQGLST